MAYRKDTGFSPDDQALAELAKALSHPARISILKILAERNTCICGEIVELLPLAQSTVSQHLKELKAVGLVQGEVEGPKSCYCVNWKTVGKLQGLLNGLFEGMDKSNRKNCC